VGSYFTRSPLPVQVLEHATGYTIAAQGPGAKRRSSRAGHASLTVEGLSVDFSDQARWLPIKRPVGLYQVLHQLRYNFINSLFPTTESHYIKQLSREFVLPRQFRGGSL
jgi:hypothetical protein